MLDQIKEAFQKVKQDIDSLKTQIEYLAEEIAQLKRTQERNPTQSPIPSTSQQIVPTHRLLLQVPISPKTAFSTGNEGVPTNQPTIQPTNQHSSVSYGKTHRSSVNKEGSD